MLNPLLHRFVGQHSGAHRLLAAALSRPAGPLARLHSVPSSGQMASAAHMQHLQGSAAAHHPQWLPARCRGSLSVCRRPAAAHPGQQCGRPSPMAPSNSGARLPLRVLLPVCHAAGGAGGGGGSKGYGSGGAGAGAGDSSGGSGPWEAYNELLGKYPLLVKAVTTAVLSAVGNLICQFLVEGKQELDWRRFNTFTALGFVWVAPCLHFWFGALNRIVTAPGNAGALARMALDQLGFAPLFIGSMIAILAVLDGRPLDQAGGVVRRDLPDAIRANWALWVPAQFVNFRFVPGNYQVLFANMVALVWNVYFSFATRPKAAA